MSTEITGKVWNGLVHIRVVYKDAEYLLDAKRVLYFPVYYQKLAHFFKVAHDQPIWLEYERVPLKWNLPIGLLYDLLYVPSDRDNTVAQPWKLCLAAALAETPYPAHHIIPFNCDRADGVLYTQMLDQILINSLKQSCYVSNGNSRSVMALSDNDTRSLWRAMANHDLAVFSSIRAKIAVPAKDTRQRVPIKMYVAGSAMLLQAPVWSKNTDGVATTLRQSVCEQMTGILPDLPFPQIYIHGINVDVLLNEPVLDVWTQFRYMDNFLYIVIVARDRGLLD